MKRAELYDIYESLKCGNVLGTEKTRDLLDEAMMARSYLADMFAAYRDNSTPAKEALEFGCQVAFEEGV